MCNNSILRIDLNTGDILVENFEYKRVFSLYFIGIVYPIDNEKRILGR